MRPWPDSDVTVTQRWYPAAPGAAHLQHTSAYLSPDWDESDWCELDAPGAIIDAPRTFNYRGPIAGLGGAGGHVCGTVADFLGQTLYNPDVEPVVYDDADIPACCDHVVAPVGGGEADGEAIVGVVSNTCETAESLDDLFVSVPFPLSPGQTLWTITHGPLSGSHAWRLDVSAGSAEVTWYRGPSCGSQTILPISPATATPSLSQQSVAVETWLLDEDVWCKIVGGAGVDGCVLTYTV